MTNKGFNIQWHITDRCNCRCAHCYQSGYTNEASWEQMRHMLEQFALFFNSLERPGFLTITGGEPLIHPHFWALLDLIKSDYPEIGRAVLTNGTLIGHEYACRLKKSGMSYVQVSVEGDAATHDEIRGAGTYDKAMDGIACLSSANIPVSISFTAHRLNYRQISDVAAIASRNKGVKVWSDRMIPAVGDSLLECMNPEESYDYLKRLRNARNVSLNRALQFLEGGRAYRCSAGESLMAVLPDGTVYPCRRLPLAAGNVLEESLNGIYNRNLMQSLREGQCEDCSRCLYQQICNGGLRCLAYASTGNMWAPDPGCPVQAGIYKVQTGRWL